LTTFVTSGQLLNMNIISRHSCLYSLPSILDAWSPSTGPNRTRPASPEVGVRTGPRIPDRERLLSEKSPSDSSLILQWAQSTESASKAEIRTRTALFLHSVPACAIFVGFSAGLGAGAAIFWYDGSQPINILSVLSSLVLAPALLLLPAILLGIFAPVMRRFQIKRSAPFIPILSKPLRSAISRMIPESRELFATATTLTAFHFSLYGKVEALYLSLTSQLFTLCFLLGSGGYGIWKMITTDLAFCWSATPALITPALVQQATSVLALPWSFLDPAAAPSLQLIEKTRYYRLHAPLRSSLEYDPAVMGQWWAFLVLTIITWTVLPRLILLLTTLVRYKNVVSYTLLHLPHVPALLAELRPDAFHTTVTPEMSDKPQPRNRENFTDNSDTPPIQIPPATTNSKIILWSMQDLDLNLRTLLPQVSQLSPIHAGGTTSTSEESALLNSVSKITQLDLFIILVKSWEPPLLEFLDFIGDLRKVTQRTTPIFIVPIALDKEATENMVWTRVLGRLADPWIHVTRPLSISM
jgi:hypothetical protein